MGLSLEAYQALDPTDRDDRLAKVRASLMAAGADLVIDSVDDLIGALQNRKS
jgi:phosphoglycolate phosphatase-like HAD superfamily hydrolase